MSPSSAESVEFVNKMISAYRGWIYSWRVKIVPWLILPVLWVTLLWSEHSCNNFFGKFVNFLLGNEGSNYSWFTLFTLLQVCRLHLSTEKYCNLWRMVFDRSSTLHSMTVDKLLGSSFVRESLNSFISSTLC